MDELELIKVLRTIQTVLSEFSNFAENNDLSDEVWEDMADVDSAVSGLDSEIEALMEILEKRSRKSKSR